MLQELAMRFRDQRVTQVPVLLFVKVCGDTEISEEKRPKGGYQNCAVVNVGFQQRMLLTHVKFNSV